MVNLTRNLQETICPFLNQSLSKLDLDGPPPPIAHGHDRVGLESCLVVVSLQPAL